MPSKAIAKPLLWPSVDETRRGEVIQAVIVKASSRPLPAPKHSPLLNASLTNVTANTTVKVSDIKDDKTVSSETFDCPPKEDGLKTTCCRSAMMHNTPKGSNPKIQINIGRTKKTVSVA